MGLDWFELRLRIERDFGVRIRQSDFQFMADERRADLTAGELYQVVCAKLRAAGRPIPWGAWNRAWLGGTPSLSGNDLLEGRGPAVSAAA
jgi:hypothetical protein